MTGSMIGSIADILRMYWAMLWYYILKLPYVFRIAASMVTVCAGTWLLVKIVGFIIKKILFPLFIWILKVLILILQRIIYSIVRMSPGWAEKGSHMDDRLNKAGIFLEAASAFFKKDLKELYEKLHLKKIVKKISIPLALVIGMFVIIPYYLEPVVTGEAKRICGNINDKSRDIQNGLWKYVNQYYTPVMKVSNEPEEPETEDREEGPVILHLGPEGRNGANLRSSPEKKNGNIIKAVSGDVELYYENEVQKSGGTVWVKVSTEDAREGWISKKLLDKQDCEDAGID